MITTELLNHVESLNVKAEAWMAEAPEGSFRMAAIYDERDIEDRVKYNGVKTPADWDALSAWEDFYDLYKDVEGISPRWTKWSDNTAENWEKEIALLGDYSEGIIH
jgi:hypothetical protein